MSQSKICPYCQKHFNTGYYSRHLKVCIKKGSANNNHIAIDLSFLEDEECNNETSFVNDMMSDDDDHVFENLNEENPPDLNCPVNNLVSEMVDEVDLEGMVNDFAVEIPNVERPRQLIDSFYLVTWICLFLALWQYTFSITDTAMELLVKFLKAFLHVLGQKSEDIAKLASMMPPSLYMLFKSVRCNDIIYEKYVICVKCFKLYKFEDCVTHIRGIPASKTCSNILFPFHPQRHRRKPCGQLLMIKYVTSSGKSVLYPIKTYCYLPVQKSLEILLKREGFMSKCELWRKRKSYNDVYSDIYDGKIWKEFADPNGYDFFSKKNNYGLMLNLDWFCPYKHVKSYSVGVIYAVITNLPRSERFRRENLLLIGIIPSMKKEPATNTFIEPLVKELNIAWDRGLSFNLPYETLNPVIIRLALILVGCDIPACRKLCGFLGTNITNLL